MKKQLAILGSTGSIGTQTLEVVAEYPDLFEVYTLTANNNVDLLIEQAKHLLYELSKLIRPLLWPIKKHW